MKIKEAIIAYRKVKTKNVADDKEISLNKTNKAEKVMAGA